MSSRKIIISNSSEDDETKYASITDEKKRKRMISNRESARRSRMKREQHIKELNDKIGYFTTRNSEMARKIKETEQRFVAADSENRALRIHGEELKKRLEMLEGMLVPYNASSSSNVSDDVVENDDFRFVMDILQEPWLQPPFQSQTIAGVYQF